MRNLTWALPLLIVSHFSFSQPHQIEIPYYPNESIRYNVYYGIFKIGIAHLEYNNKSCNNAFILAEAQSTGLVKFFKKIHYKYECCMDTSTGLPIYDSRILIEGDYQDFNTVHYNHTFRNDSSMIFSKKTDTILVPKGIYDLLSGFYHYRANYIPNKLNKSKNASITTYFTDNIWQLNISYHGTETVETAFGPKECYIIKPETIVGHFFSSPDAMTIWITKDKYTVPVKFRLEFKLGTLYGDITDYKKPCYL